MRGPVRGVLATPVFLLWGVLAFELGGTSGLGGVALLAIGAAVAGYLVGSSWALLIATPFVAYGLSNISSPGPLENTDSGWGGIILLIVALPVATCTTLGVIISLALSAEPESVNQKSI